MESLPIYSVTGEDDIAQRLAATPSAQLPILRSPPEHTQRWSFFAPDPLSPKYEAERARQLEFDVIVSFFDAIEASQDDVVASFISRGLVSPDATSSSGETPLLAAVRMNCLPMISTLVAHGATVDMLGNARPSVLTGSLFPERETLGPRRMRTPLQLAAEDGKLSLVKVLFQDYGANDAIIAPDGTLALRVAAANGHREIVDLLPARRGGARTRWKTAHKAEMKIVIRLLKRTRETLLIVFWHIPKWLVLELPIETTIKVWKNRHRAVRWVKRQAQELPRRVKKVITKAPEYAKRLASELGHLLSRALQRLWTIIKAIPGLIKDILLWAKQAVQQSGEFILDAVNRLFSVVHTAISAVISFFERITLKDIKDGLVYLARAVFIEGPKTIASLSKSLWEACQKTIVTMFGCLGRFVVGLCKAIVWLILYVPKKMWRCLEAMGRSTRQGYREARAHFNPKHI